jgi:hypothetical protein
MLLRPVKKEGAVRRRQPVRLLVRAGIGCVYVRTDPPRHRDRTSRYCAERLSGLATVSVTMSLGKRREDQVARLSTGAAHLSPLPPICAPARSRSAVRSGSGRPEPARAMSQLGRTSRSGGESGKVRNRRFSTARYGPEEWRGLLLSSHSGAIWQRRGRGWKCVIPDLQGPWCPWLRAVVGGPKPGLPMLCYVSVAVGGADGRGLSPSTGLRYGPSAPRTSARRKLSASSEVERNPLPVTPFSLSIATTRESRQGG